jgi:hypothetical protein
MLLLCLSLAACGRPLTQAERDFAATVQGPGLAADRVRVTRAPFLGRLTQTRPPRPQLACRERIWPPETGPVVTTSTAAFVLFDRIFVADRLWREDYLAPYPDRLPLVQAMLLAHELTHVWQWQNRARTGYTPLKALAEHSPGADPYLFDLRTDARFADFSYEQQGGIVEEFVCCRALDPDGARTQRLRRLLAAPFPSLAAREAAPEIALPWKGAETRGICG